MLTIFRRIRKSLIDSNNARKYFFYAVGEIFLVIIGILIALAINNSNQKRIQNEKTESVFIQILYDLEQDVYESNELLTNLNRKDSLCKRVLLGEHTFSDYRNGTGYITLIANYEEMNFSDNGYNMLVQQSDAIQEKFQTAYNYLSEMHLKDKPKVVLANKSLVENVHETFSKWADTFLWYSKFPNAILIPEGIEYFLNDPNYQNRVKLYHVIVENNLIPTIKKYKTQAVLSYHEIHKHLKSKPYIPKIISDYMISLDDEIMQAYCGNYKHPFADLDLIISLKNKNLVFSSPLRKETPFYPRNDTTFFSPEVSFTLLFNTKKDSIPGTLKTIQKSGYEIKFNKNN